MEEFESFTVRCPRCGQKFTVRNKNKLYIRDSAPVPSAGGFGVTQPDIDGVVLSSSTVMVGCPRRGCRGEVQAPPVYWGLMKGK